MSNDLDRSHTIDAFCELEQLSPHSYYKLRRLGLGPREMRVPGTKIVRISEAARREWRTRLEQVGASEQAEHEFRVRAAECSRAAKLGVDSPRHPCHRPTAAGSRSLRPLRRSRRREKGGA
jgi:hypothetical protein